MIEYISVLSNFGELNQMVSVCGKNELSFEY
jgi:hypothetical protein